MADIKISQPHPFDTDEATRRCREYVDKIKNDLGLKVTWDGNKCTFRGPAKGTLEVHADKVDVEVKLGLAARLIRKKIEEKLGSGLTKALG